MVTSCTKILFQRIRCLCVLRTRSYSCWILTPSVYSTLHVFCIVLNPIRNPSCYIIPNFALSLTHFYTCIYHMTCSSNVPLSITCRLNKSCNWTLSLSFTNKAYKVLPSQIVLRITSTSSLRSSTVRIFFVFSSTNWCLTRFFQVIYDRTGEFLPTSHCVTSVCMHIQESMCLRNL